MCYKMLHGVLDIYVSSFVLIDVMYTRGNCKKLAKPCTLSVRDGNVSQVYCKYLEQSPG